VWTATGQFFLLLLFFPAQSQSQPRIFHRFCITPSSSCRSIGVPCSRASGSAVVLTASVYMSKERRKKSRVALFAPKKCHLFSTGGLSLSVPTLTCLVALALLGFFLLRFGSPDGQIQVTDLPP
jgi:hypothetical protein